VNAKNNQENSRIFLLSRESRERRQPVYPTGCRASRRTFYYLTCFPLDSPSGISISPERQQLETNGLRRFVALVIGNRRTGRFFQKCQRRRQRTKEFVDFLSISRTGAARNKRLTAFDSSWKCLQSCYIPVCENRSRGDNGMKQRNFLTCVAQERQQLETNGWWHCVALKIVYKVAIYRFVKIGLAETMEWNKGIFSHV